jgi:NAD(P)-dependent dehydrogenase (short-subunit alcohol dehydrogenase family)
MRLSDRKAVILGGAGRIGEAVVKSFLENGARVMPVDRDTQGLSRLMNGLKDEWKENCHPHSADIKSEKDAGNLVNTATKTLGGIDCYIHLPGGIYRAPFVSHSLKELDMLWEANVRVPFLACQAFGEFMEKQQRGKIILFASIGGMYPEENHSGYCAVKAALIGFARVAALELAGNNVQVNIIAPGPTEATPFRSRFYLDNPDVLAGIEARTPAGRIGHPEDHAGLAVFLAGDESGWLSGQVIASDGGLSLT